MSWRDVLGVVSRDRNIDTQYPHNTHNALDPGNSAYIAECAEDESKKRQSDAKPCKRTSSLKVVADNKQVSIRRRRLVRTYRVHVDNKSLIFIDHTRTDDVGALMVQKFGVDRVGKIHELTGKRGKGNQRG